MRKLILASGKEIVKRYAGSRLVWEKTKMLVAEGVFLSKDMKSGYEVVPIDDSMITEQGICIHLIDSVYINGRWIGVKFINRHGTVFRLRFYPWSNLKSNTGLDSLPKDSVIKLRYKPLELNSPYKKAVIIASRLTSEENNFLISKSSLGSSGIPADSIKQIVHGERLVDVTFTGERSSYLVYTTVSGESFESITGYDYKLSGNYIVVFYESR